MGTNDAAIQQQLIEALSRFADTDSSEPPNGPERTGGGSSSDESAMETICYRFATGNISWVFPAEQRAEVFMDLDIAPVPGAPTVLEGLCQVRGKILPVYAIHTLTGEPLPRRPVTLVFHLNDGPVGLLVDAPPQKQRVRGATTGVTDAVSSDFPLGALTTGTYRDADESLWALSPSNLGTGLRALASNQPLESTP